MEIRNYCKKIDELNTEIINDVTKFVDQAGGLIFTDPLARKEMDASLPIYAYHYDEVEERVVECPISAVSTENGRLIVYLSDSYYNECYIEKEDRNIDFLEEYYIDNKYCVDGDMILINATLYNLCELLPEYINK